jgi:hypothetical protein
LPQAARALTAPPPERVQRGEFDPLRLLWVWCVFVLVFFSLSDSKLIPYILPAVPALALLCAGRCAGAGEGQGQGQGQGQGEGQGESRGSLLAGALLTLASCAGLMGYLRGLWGSADARELLPLIRPVLYWTCALLALGALTCALCAQRGRPLAALAGLCGSWFLASGTILVAAIPAQAQFSAKDLALALRSRAAVDGSGRLPMDVPIFAVRAYEQSLAFYLQRTVILVDYRDEFDLGLTQSPRLGIATLEQFTDVWRPLGGGFAVMPPSTRDRLSALGLPMHEIARLQDRVIISRR